MARWRQVFDKETQTSSFIPIDEAAARRDAGVSVHGDIQPFRSPIDGTVISDRKQYREHCKKHNVVPAAEFSPEFYAKKAKERADAYEGRRSTAEAFARKQEIHELMMRAERNGR